ncbi:MAG: hypothetical protein KDK66_07140 [Deltaproteobacteria bacterium]|nr:hypothetical protein [Deltaproteobacteria bacterium]
MSMEDLKQLHFFSLLWILSAFLVAALSFPQDSAAALYLDLPIADAPTKTKQSNIGLLYHPEHVNTAENGEATNLLNHIESLGYEVSLFEETLSHSTELENFLADKQVFIVPELSVGDIDDNINSQSRQVLRSFLESGGRMLVFASDSYKAFVFPQISNSVDFINDLLTISVKEARFTATGHGVLTEEAAYSVLSQGPQELPYNDLTVLLKGNQLPQSLPNPAMTLYKDSVSDNAAVVLFPYFAGELIYFGWDFYDYLNQAPQWLGLVNLALKEVDLEVRGQIQVEGHQLEIDLEVENLSSNTATGLKLSHAKPQHFKVSEAIDSNFDLCLLGSKIDCTLNSLAPKEVAYVKIFLETTEDFQEGNEVIFPFSLSLRELDFNPSNNQLQLSASPKAPLPPPADEVVEESATETSLPIAGGCSLVRY